MQMLDKNREAQTVSLNDLQNELKSLKSLLISRGQAAPVASVSSLGNRLGGGGTTLGGTAKGIPSWQLADSLPSSASASTSKGAYSTASLEALPIPDGTGSSRPGEDAVAQTPDVGSSAS